MFGPYCFRGAVFAEAFTGDDPLRWHVRTRVKSPQTNGVIERFFGTLRPQATRRLSRRRLSRRITVVAVCH